MKRFTKLISFGGLICLFCSLPVRGQDISDLVVIHGFASQGYYQTTNNNFLIANSKEGSFEFSEVALTIMAMPSDRFRVGIQFFGRDLGDQGNNNITVDWAYGDYRWRDFLGVRFGRIKVPVSLYNTVRDIDIARVPILLPQANYWELMRDFDLAVNGISLHGNLPLDFLGEFDYEVYWGDVNIPDAGMTFFQNSFYQAGNGIATGMSFTPGVISASYEGSSDEKIRLYDLRGFLATWNTPISGLKLGYALMRQQLDMSLKLHINITTGDPANPITVPSTVPMEGEYDVGHDNFFAEYSLGNLMLTGEYRTMFMNKIGASEITREAYYGMVSYRFTDKFTVSSYYSEFYPDIDDKDGASLSAANKDKFEAWQKDICLTTRFDLTPHWVLKLEYHSLNGTGQITEINNQNGFKKNWSIMAVKSTFHF